MEASIVLVPSKLSVILHPVVECAKLVLLVGITVHAGVVALVLLHKQLSIVRAWNVLARQLVIVPSQLIVAFLVKVETVRVKEVTTWKYVETIIVIFSISVLDFLPSVLLDSRRWLSRGLTILRKHFRRSIVLKLTKLGRRRRRLRLVLELTIGKAVPVCRRHKLVIWRFVHLEWILSHSVAVVTLM